MIGIPIKKHLKLRYQEEGRTCRTCSDRRKNEGICIKKNRTNDIGGISSFYFYFPLDVYKRHIPDKRDFPGTWDVYPAARFHRSGSQRALATLLLESWRLSFDGSV